MAKTYRAGVIGFAHMHINELMRRFGEMPNVEWVACADTRPARPELVEARFTRDWNKRHAHEEIGIPKVYDDYREMLDQERFDLVLFCPENARHAEVAEAIAARGAHMLTEKPMAAGMAQAREMVAASERAGKLYMVSQSRRYDPNLHAMRRLVEEHVGDLGILNSDFYIGAHFGGFRDEMPSPLLLDMAIHTLDQARYISGADPVAVYCDEFNPAWSWYRGDACATAIFEMTGGLRYTYRGSWCSEGRHTSWDGEWRAVGPHGTATWDGRDAPVAEVVVEPGGFHAKTETHTGEVAPDVPRGIAGSLRDFLHALETGATPMGECHDNIKSLAMVFGAIESARTGQRVSLTS